MITRRSLLLFAALLALSASCGDANLFDGLADDSSRPARIEAARIALDGGDYSAAISILEAECGSDPSMLTCDADTAALLASAYAARAGLNVFALLDAVVTLPDGLDGSFASFSTMFSDATDAEKGDLQFAVSILAELPQLTPNQNLELAVVGLAAIVATIGADLTGGFDPVTGLPNVDPDLTDVQNAEAAESTVTIISDTLALVVQGVAGSGLAGETVVDDISEVENAIDANQDQLVTDMELDAFLAVLNV